MVGRTDIEEAARRIEAVIRPTPVVSSPALSRLAGCPVLLKPEHLQRTGSFKIRGAYNRVAMLAEQRTAAEVAAASAGNHAQGVALAASMRAALDHGAPVLLDSACTMADGIAVRRVSELTLEHVRFLVDDIVTVEEEEISEAVLLLLERCKAVVEPAGAVGLVHRPHGTSGLDLTLK